MLMKTNLTAEEKSAWVAALRSGKYKQSDGVIRRKEEDGSFSYCVLGVLCDVLEPDGWKKPVVSEDLLGRTYYDNYSYHNNCDENFGPFFSGEKLDFDAAHVIYSMNDCGYDFDALSDFIEENVETC